MFRLITLCSNEDTSQDELEYIVSYVDSATDSTLESIVEISHREGLLPIVYKKLKSLPIDNRYLLSRLKQAYLHIVQKNMLFATQLTELTTLLEENGIDVISIKGVTLAQLAYGDITLRQFGDIDILVRESQLQRADKILRDHGYHSLYGDKILSSDICLERLIDISYIKQERLLELHWRLLESKHNGDIALNQPFDSTQPIDIYSTLLYTLSNEPLLIYITLHGAKHAWSRIGWICDIDRLIRTNDIKWQRCVDIARESKIERAFYVGLQISHHLYDTPLPSEILMTIERMKISEMTLSTIDRFDRYIIEKPPMKRREIFMYQLGLFESRREQIFFLIETIFAISPADCIRFTIPNRWRFLYIFMRPYRIVMKVLFRR